MNFPIRSLSLLTCAASLLNPVTSSLAQSAGGFVATRGIPTGGSAYSSATADFNNDGIPDIVVADGTRYTSSDGTITQTPQGIAVLLGNGDGTFKPAVHYATTHSASWVAVADFNGDGNMDVVTANFDPTLMTPGGEINVLLGKGDGTFEAAVSYSVPSDWVSAIYIGDFNGDGHPDLAVTTEQVSDPHGLGLAVFLNNGNGTFHLGQQIANVAPEAIADFDKDGKLDLVVVHYAPGNTGPSASVGVLYGNGDGTFTRNGPTYYVGTGTSFWSDGSQVAVGDFNEDGYLDMAIADGLEPGSLLLLLGQPNGTFEPAAHPPALEPNPTSIIARDFNHDGHLDLAVLAGNDVGVVDVLFGDGKGGFSFRDIYGNDGTGSDGGGRLAAADFNGDGNLDLLTTNNSGTVSVAFGKPGGAFAAERIYTLGSFENLQTVTGDFNGDGKPDIAVLNAGGGCDTCYGSVSILQGDGFGLFKPLGVRYKLTTKGLAFAVGDVNRDGKLDLVVAGYGTESNATAAINVLLGNGNGTFQPARSFPITGSTVQYQIFLADMNNDGKLDIVTQGGIRLGNGDGTFQSLIPFNFAGGSYFAIGDFNRDGKLDLAFISDDEPAEVNIHLGDGKGHINADPSFTAALPWGEPYHTRIATGHFTTNGYLGVVAGVVDEFVQQSPEVGGFSILGGNGDGTLMAPVSYQLTQYLQDFQTADFNGDGLDDIAVLNGGSINPVNGVYSIVSLYTSNGDGTATHTGDFGAGGIGAYSGGALAKADFNGDGAIDLAGNISTTGMGVLLNSRGSNLVLTSSSGTVSAGQSVTFTSTGTASFRFSGPMTGTVSFYDGALLLGKSDVGPGGIAQFTISTLTPGTHHIQAKYSGGTNFNPQTSNTLSEVVNP